MIMFEGFRTLRKMFRRTLAVSHKCFGLFSRQDTKFRFFCFRPLRLNFPKGDGYSRPLYFVNFVFFVVESFHRKRRSSKNYPAASLWVTVIRSAR